MIREYWFRAIRFSFLTAAVLSMAIGTRGEIDRARHERATNSDRHFNITVPIQLHKLDPAIVKVRVTVKAVWALSPEVGGYIASTYNIGIGTVDLDIPANALGELVRDVAVSFNTIEERNPALATHYLAWIGFYAENGTEVDEIGGEMRFRAKDGTATKTSTGWVALPSAPAPSK